MTSKHDLANHIQFLNSMSEFVSSYQELTVFRMKERRDVILNSRAYTDGLLDVFVDLKQSMKSFLGRIGFFNQSASILTQASKINLETLQKNNQKLAVFLTFDAKFARQTMLDVFETFSKFISQNPDYEVAVVGEIGKSLYAEKFGKSKPFQYFALSENGFNQQEIQTLGGHILQYGKVTVFNPYYVSLVKQEVRSTNLTGDIPVIQDEINVRLVRRFLYEPGGEKMLAFFEKQIVLAVLKQTIKESLLAILGSRIGVLEQTRKNLELEDAKYTLLHKKQMRYLIDRKQRERMAGQSLWGIT
jgi:F0F1-type ATP synthase gamma subunit